MSSTILVCDASRYEIWQVRQRNGPSVELGHLVSWEPWVDVIWALEPCAAVSCSLSLHEQGPGYRGTRPDK